ncbi:probable basic-leucine zipper transcription factor K [Arachis ipaensis]|uniref:probable basic-leucine zipper transcription factor K n=1 Tax=Arachis ipaensis TaxID=130454 RepID=UPI0007AF833F|nr:probable basic-leucine zipper transcription factor K [Arachis ipaensis]XP_025664877.1 probable basic-leucine zipper transcription factor K [Arachis hypogaea]
MRVQQQQEDFQLRYIRDQEKQEEFQQQYMRSQERQEELQLRIMDQQRDFQSRFLDSQREQSTQFQESFNKLSEQQVEQEKYILNLYHWKNVYHTTREARHFDRVEYDIDTQAQLDYLVASMATLNQEIPPFDKVPRPGELQKSRAKRNAERMKQRLQDAEAKIARCWILGR